ncbi:MAG: hypothetical protein ACK5L6_06140 [Anaerorhabdus sp.]|uniref:hypothetical protein n=1 Tax=Anaerorhabdus sp. TaxID=1872524 RepID=UPI003A8AEC6F
MEKLKSFRFNRATSQYEINGKFLDKCTRIEFDFVSGGKIRITCTFDDNPNIRIYECDTFGEECDVEIVIKNKDFSDLEF